jgi:peptide/histidine transporter 3/4
LVFSLIYMGGLGMLSASAGDSSLHPPAGEAATGSQLGFFWAAMYLIAVGTGGIKPCVSTFGADQVGCCGWQAEWLCWQFHVLASYW